MGDVFRFHSFEYDTATSWAADGWVTTNTFGGGPSHAPTFGGSSGPFGESSMNLMTTYYQSITSLNLPTPNIRFSIGGWFKWDTAVISSTIVLEVYNQTGNAIRLYIHPNGKFSIYYTNGPLASSYSSSSFYVTSPMWVHLQLDLYGGTTAYDGYAKLQVNGVEELSLTGNFQQSPWYVTRILTPSVDTKSVSVANLWLAYGGFKGPALARTLPITGVGALTELSPSSVGEDNYTMINETALDDATYNGGDASALPLTDTYQTADMVDPPEQLIAYSVKNYDKKDGPSTVVSRRVSYAGGTSYLSSPTTVGLSTAGHIAVWNVDPATSTPLTSLSSVDAKALIDGMEYGVKLSTS